MQVRISATSDDIPANQLPDEETLLRMVQETLGNQAFWLDDAWSYKITIAKV